MQLINVFLQKHLLKTDSMKKNTDKEMAIIDVFEQFYYMTIIYVKSYRPQSCCGIKYVFNDGTCYPVWPIRRKVEQLLLT